MFPSKLLVTAEAFKNLEPSGILKALQDRHRVAGCSRAEREAAEPDRKHGGGQPAVQPHGLHLGGGRQGPGVRPDPGGDQEVRLVTVTHNKTIYYTIRIYCATSKPKTKEFTRINFPYHYK